MTDVGTQSSVSSSAATALSAHDNIIASQLAAPEVIAVPAGAFLALDGDGSASPVDPSLTAPLVTTPALPEASPPSAAPTVATDSVGAIAALPEAAPSAANDSVVPAAPTVAIDSVGAIAALPEAAPTVATDSVAPAASTVATDSVAPAASTVATDSVAPAASTVAADSVAPAASTVGAIAALPDAAATVATDSVGAITAALPETTPTAATDSVAAPDVIAALPDAAPPNAASTVAIDSSTNAPTMTTTSSPTPTTKEDLCFLSKDVASYSYTMADVETKPKGTMHPIGDVTPAMHADTGSGSPSSPTSADNTTLEKMKDTLLKDNAKRSRDINKTQLSDNSCKKSKLLEEQEEALTDDVKQLEVQVKDAESVNASLATKLEGSAFSVVGGLEDVN